MIFFSPRELKSLKAGATPSRDFKAGLKKELFAAYDARYGTARGMSPFMKYSAVGMCAFTLLFGMGTGVYAYSSPDVVEGDTLYPVKSGIEQVEGAMAFTPDQKARYHAKMMQRRVQEAEHLQGRPEVAQHLAERAAGELGMTVDELRTGLRDPATRQEVIDQLSDLGVRYAQLLERVPTNAGGQPRLLPPPLRLKLRQIQQDVDQSGLTDEEKGKLFREDIRQFLEEKIEPTDTF